MAGLRALLRQSIMCLLLVTLAIPGSGGRAEGLPLPACCARLQWIFLNRCPPLGLPTCPLQEHTELGCQPSMYFRQVPASHPLHPTFSLQQSGCYPGSPPATMLETQRGGKSSPESHSTENLGMLQCQQMPSPPNAIKFSWCHSSSFFIISVPDPQKSQPHSPTDLHSPFQKDNTL